LLHRLVEEQPKVLVQDWYRDQQTQTKVRNEIAKVLNQDLPESYDRSEFEKKCAKVYDLAAEYAARGRKWAA
jgi:type I restriction enzyme R subunit